MAHDGQMDLWWVNEAGALLKDRLNPDPEEWTDAISLVYGEMGPSGAKPSKLAACATDRVQTDMLWVIQTRDVHGERILTGSASDSIYGLVEGVML